MKIRCWLFVLAITASSVAAQDADSLFIKADSLFTSEDSLSIFNLIDSLLSLDELNSGSQLSVRLGYNSNVLSAGRTLGIENFGLSSGISYYHKTGLYADVAGYWSKDFTPSYYLTIASLGYMHDFSKRFSVIASYDRYFYNLPGNDDDYIPYKNTLSVTPTLEFKPVMLSASYSYYFGEQAVHRLMPGVSFVLQKKKLWNLDRVAVTPSFFLLTGNEIITEIELVPPKNLREALDNLRLYGTRFSIVQINRNVFGIMNYAMSLPLSVSYRKWGFMFTYTYNIPKALPGEPLTLSESSYLSGGLMYFIDLKRDKF
ncbi:MAG: hypothetical protein ACOYXT_23405 [Bacteroidota bacterium]